MSGLRLALLVWLLATTAPGIGPSRAPDHSADGAPTFWLSGPFGRVPGTSAEEAVAPSSVPLDAWVMDAPLVLDAGETTSWLAGLIVTARSIEGDAPAETLSVDEQRFEGPSRAGRFLLEAEFRTTDGQVIERVWLLEVPDRPAPEDGILDIPAPDIIITGGSGSATGWAGNGCYVYLCVEVGRHPPIAELPRLAVDPGEPLAAHLSDGSPIVAWKGSLAPVPSRLGPARAAGGAATDQPEPLVELAGLEAPGPGTWLLTLEVEFDRERGWMRAHYRVDVPQGGGRP